MLTDNSVLVNNIRSEPTIFCVQRTAVKKVVTEDDLINSNIAGFGDDIGKITNRVTAMYDVQSQYDKESEEYKVLDYRIKCGQLYQQNAIDSIKGIVCKPMPKHWYDRASNRIEDSDSDEERALKDFYNRIVADKKPYFMIYIYPDLKKQYTEYVRNSNIKCLREFRLTIDELIMIPDEEKTEEQREFVYYYTSRFPVGTHDCVMNRICRRFEKEFDGWKTERNNNMSFDYSLIKSGCEYSRDMYYSIRKLYIDLNNIMKDFSVSHAMTRGDSCEYSGFMASILNYFEEECYKICNNKKVLCEIVLDICYKSNSTKSFAWLLFGDQIVQTLLEKNGGVLYFPVRDDEGDINYGCSKFRMDSVEVEHDGSGAA